MSSRPANPDRGASPLTLIQPSTPPVVAIFDASHGQANWAQTGFTSREMHTNFAGVMELLCRLGCTCSSTAGQPLSPFLAQASLLVIPPPTGSYDKSGHSWKAQPGSLFSGQEIAEILSFLCGGGRLLAFGYRFGDSFTRTNLGELLSSLGCLLNDDAVIDLHVLRSTHPLDAYFENSRSLLPQSWSHDGVATVRWRTMATFTVLPGTRAQPLALSAGGSCITFNHTHQRISFASQPIAVAGMHGKGKFALFGGPHAFEVGTFGLFNAAGNLHFLRNTLRWLLEPAATKIEPAMSCRPVASGYILSGQHDLTQVDLQHNGQRTIAYVERLLQKTGVLKALSRAQWIP